MAKVGQTDARVLSPRRSPDRVLSHKSSFGSPTDQVELIIQNDIQGREMPQNLRAFILREKCEITNLYGVGLKINTESPHYVKLVTDPQNQDGSSLRSQIMPGDLLVGVEDRSTEAMDIESIERLIFGDIDSVIKMTFKCCRSGQIKEFGLRRHVLVRSVESCRKWYTLKDMSPEQQLCAEPRVLEALEEIRNSVCDRNGCFVDLMNDDGSCDVPTWNSLWNIARRPSSSLGIVFDQHLASTPGPLRIHGVISGSPADILANLRGNDEILEVEGCAVNPQNVKQKLRGQDMIGTKCDIVIRRTDGKKLQLQVQRTSAAYIFFLAQLFDLIAAHEVLVQRNARQLDMLASIKAIKNQIIEMERFRLRREACVALRIQKIQAKIFDSMIEAASTFDLRPVEENVARGRREFEPERSAQPNRGDLEFDNRIEQLSTGTLGRGGGEQEKLRFEIKSLNEDKDLLSMHTDRLNQMVSSTRNAVELLEKQNCGMATRLSELEDKLATANHLLASRDLQLESELASNKSLQEEINKLKVSEREARCHAAHTLQLQQENKKLAEAINVHDAQKECYDAELRQCKAALENLEAEFAWYQKKSGHDAETIETLKANNQLLLALNASEQREDERVILLDHECRSLKTKIVTMEQDFRNQVHNLMVQKRKYEDRIEEMKDLAGAHRDLQGQILRYESQISELLKNCTRKSVVGLELETQAPFRVIRVTELMDSDSKINNQRVLAEDELLGIDGVAIASLQSETIFQMLSGLPGSLVTLSFRRRASRKEFTVVAQRHLQITNERTEGQQLPTPPDWSREPGHEPMRCRSFEMSRQSHSLSAIYPPHDVTASIPRGSAIETTFGAGGGSLSVRGLEGMESNASPMLTRRAGQGIVADLFPAASTKGSEPVRKDSLGCSVGVSIAPVHLVSSPRRAEPYHPTGLSVSSATQLPQPTSRQFVPQGQGRDLPLNSSTPPMSVTTL